jgi:DNA polymerase-1
MAKVLYSDELPHGGAAGAHYDESLWLYNALDNCITYEVHEALNAFDGGFAYDMSRMMQAPALAMMLRGLRVDFHSRDESIHDLSLEAERYSNFLSRLTCAVLDRPINHRSPDQLKNFFYSVLRIPPIHRYDKTKRERVVTTNREAMEKLLTYPRARPFAILILALRDVEKKLSTLRTGIDPDGRLRCSYHVTGTETGRWSSSDNVFYRGTNLQNITDKLRRIVVPDPGKKFLQFDLAQAESVVVAYVSGDENYQRACMSGDPHTYVCTMCWPQLAWSTDRKANRAIAEQKYYRDFSYRDLAKRGGHGSNYGGTPPVLQIHLKIERKVAEDFQTRYFKEFPGIRRWHTRVMQTLASTRTLTTALGRKRFFPGRPTDSSVIKEAIAYEPQSVIGDYLNYGLYLVWRELELSGRVELLAQVHDSILLQFDPAIEDEAQLIADVQRLLAVEITINDKPVVIKSDAVSGWNWGKRRANKDGSVENHYGLSDWTGSDSRTPPPERSPLDRRVSLINQSFK